MRISVGVPAYNQGQYLAETLDSLLSQTVPPDEIVVSDNHSTDETPDVLRRYEGRVRIIRPPEHLPMTAHWNFLTRNLIGDWFSLLSSDDVALPCFVEALSSGIAGHESAVLIRAGWDVIDPGGRPVDRRYLLSVRRRTPPPATFWEQVRGPKTSFAAFLCRTEAWRQVGGFPTNLRVYGDWGLWLRLSPLGDFIHVPRIVSQYRSHQLVQRSVSRILDGIRDEVIVNQEIIPSIAKQFGEHSASRGLPAAQENFARALAVGNALCAASDREQAIKLLQPWASAVGCEDLLYEFSNGLAMESPAHPHRFLRRLLRRPYQAVLRWRP